MDAQPEGEGGPGDQGEEVVFRRVADGYDPEQVDRYVRELRRALAGARGRVAVEQASARGLQARMDWLIEQGGRTGGASYSGLGQRIEQLLRLAEEQAQDVVAAARREAAQTLAWAETGLPDAEREQVLRRLHEQVRAEVEAELQAGRGAAGSGSRRSWLGRR